jgi:hypothetical protein
MWHSAVARHKHCQALCQRLQDNCSPCEECNTRIVLMVRIHHHIPGPRLRRYVCNATCRLGDRKSVFLHQRVRCSVRAVRAVQNTQVFLTETRVDAVDDLMLLLIPPGFRPVSSKSIYICTYILFCVVLALHQFVVCSGR